MGPYLLVFGTTAAIIDAGFRLHGRFRWMRGILISVAIGAVSVLAGARDPGVGGPDALVYGNRIFHNAVSSGTFIDHLARSDAQTSIGYHFLNFVVSRFTVDVQVFYGVLAMIVASLVLLAIGLLREVGNPGIMWFTFLCLHFIETWNLLRQSLALALCLVGVALALRQRKWCGLLVGAGGLLFHDSALVFVLIWGLIIYLKKRGTPSVKRTLVVILIASGAALGSSWLMEAFVTMGDARWVDHVDGSNNPMPRGFGVEDLYRLIPLAIGVFTVRAMGRKRRSDAVGSLTGDRRMIDAESREMIAYCLVVLLAVDLVLISARGVSFPASRVVLYFGWTSIFAYGAFAKIWITQRFVVEGSLMVINLAFLVAGVLRRPSWEYRSVILDEHFNQSGIAWIALVGFAFVGIVSGGLALGSSIGARQDRSRDGVCELTDGVIKRWESDFSRRTARGREIAISQNAHG